MLRAQSPAATLAFCTFAWPLTCGWLAGWVGELDGWVGWLSLVGWIGWVGWAGWLGWLAGLAGWVGWLGWLAGWLGWKIGSDNVLHYHCRS